MSTLTRQQINWAASHDWYHSSNRDGTIWIVDRWVDMTDPQRTPHEVIRLWDGTFQALRAWAGY